MTSRHASLQRAAEALSDLADQAQRQMELASLVRQTLSPLSRPGFSGSDLKPCGALTVYAAAPEWAARLRFEAARIQQVAADNDWPVKQVRITVAR